jgi:hypothetical protein
MGATPPVQAATEPRTLSAAVESGLVGHQHGRVLALSPA